MSYALYLFLLISAVLRIDYSSVYLLGKDRTDFGGHAEVVEEDEE